VNLGSRIGQKPVVVRKTEKLGERERKALFPSKGKGNDDDAITPNSLKLVRHVLKSAWVTLRVVFEARLKNPDYT